MRTNTDHPPRAAPEPVVAFRDVSGFESWLAAHHARSPGIWVPIARKGADTPLIGLADALDAALCFGWIDSHRRGRDAGSYLQRYSPRRPGSAWSQLNRGKAEELIAVGRMRPAGMTAVEAARADGRWDAAYASQRHFSVPRDLAFALACEAGTAQRFEGLSRGDRYTLVLPLLKARTPAARDRELHRILASLRDLAEAPG